MSPYLMGAAIFTAIGFIVLAIEIRRAPEGYEDERGFHYGKPPRQ